jgi:hypothetical protein
MPFNKTFNWLITPADSVMAEPYYLDTQLKSNLKRAITEELQNLGYTHDQMNPALLIKFSVFNQPSRLYQFDRFNTRQNPIGNSDNTEKCNYNVDPGTLLISFIHPNTNKIIWEGFASGVIDSHRLKKNILKMNEGVRLIFQEFPFRIDSHAAHLD